MIFLFLTLFSFSQQDAQAARSVSRAMLVGIEQSLPATYFQLFEHKDKASNDYVVIAHQATMDLMHAATEAGKNGQMLQKFRYLKLTNHLFQHRGDVSTAFQKSGNELVVYLNSSPSCNEYFEEVLTELKTAQPAKLSAVDKKICENIQSSVRDIPVEALTQVGTAAWEKELAQVELAKSKSREAFTGYLRFDSIYHVYNRDKTLMVEFELTRKNNSLTASSLLENAFQTQPLELVAKFLTSEKTFTVPVRMMAKKTSEFDMWLRTFNLFLFREYPARQVSHRNSQSQIELKSDKVTVTLGKDSNGDILSNRWVFEHLPEDIAQNVKKIVIQ